MTKDSSGETLGSSVIEPVPGVRYAGMYGATDTTTGKIAWKIDVPLLAKSGLLVVGDLVFFGEKDGRFHAVDARTGAILWTFQGTSFPQSGGSAAVPIAYVAAGQEFVVNAFGGNYLDNGFQYAPSGDALVAFALPPAHASSTRGRPPRETLVHRPASRVERRGRGLPRCVWFRWPRGEERARGAGGRRARGDDATPRVVASSLKEPPLMSGQSLTAVL